MAPTKAPLASRKAALRSWLGRLAVSARAPVTAQTPFGAIDEVTVEQSGQLIVTGWVADPRRSLTGLIDVRVDGAGLPLQDAFRSGRPDVRAALGSSEIFHGATWVYLLGFPRAERGRITVEASGVNVVDRVVDLPAESPPMAHLLAGDQRYGRDGVYGSGPPIETTSPEVLAIAERLPGPVLDLGCGVGALVRDLRARGTEAIGIELDRPEIVDHIQPDVRPFITLSDGGFPLPYPDRAFASGVAFEVLEHIPDVVTAARELVRVVEHEIAVSVPDASAVPTLFAHNVVPWHLLEATHLHFFTVAALARLFEPEFEVLEEFRLNRRLVNGTVFYDSFALRLRRRPPTE